MMRLIIAGGGTGGHLYPGIAVAQEAVREGAEVLFIGTSAGIESRVLPREGFKLATVAAGKYKGMGMVDRLRTIAGIPGGVAGASRIIKSFGADVVLGVGGYSSFPALAAAKLMRLPVVIQEQNALPGLTNRLMGPFADVVALGFEGGRKFFGKTKTVFTGNPIRSDMLGADRGSSMAKYGLSEGKRTVLVFGGSAGAHSINKGIVEALPLLMDSADKVQFIHQTGERDLDMVERAYRESSFTASVMPFIYGMAEAYACADLVVCRSGALTLAEITALGKPALLIPYPHAADNHQMVNALALEEAGAARVIPDHDASGERLAKEILGLLDDAQVLRYMSARSLSLGRPDAARDVFLLCRELAAV
ncbi:MAG: undecaprenyldiphospho-muramoylpentapeptide beta-N-acetylglucosaminyltransferase [Nitrospirota bacterium]